MNGSKPGFESTDRTSKSELIKFLKYYLRYLTLCFIITVTVTIAIYFPIAFSIALVLIIMPVFVYLNNN